MTFVDGGSVKKYTPPAPSPQRPALGSDVPIAAGSGGYHGETGQPGTPNAGPKPTPASRMANAPNPKPPGPTPKGGPAIPKGQPPLQK